MSQRYKSQFRKRALRTGSVLLLVFLYVAGNVQVESFHKIFHSFEQALHSFDQENDPCHRAIYHDSKQDGCDHKTHVTEVKKCPLCHIVPLNDKHFAVTHVFESFSCPANHESFSISILVLTVTANLSARAPPVS